MNSGPLVSEATALPTEPHNHCPRVILFGYYFVTEHSWLFPLKLGMPEYKIVTKITPQKRRLLCFRTVIVVQLAEQSLLITQDQGLNH